MYGKNKTLDSDPEGELRKKDKTPASKGVAPILKRLCSLFLRSVNGVLHGIPIELSSIISPEKKKAVMAEYQETLRSSGGQAIRDKVNAMLQTLKNQFPDLQKGSTAWIHVRAYFFNEVGLWGKAG